MPNYDSTGPLGEGPRTGRRFGRCKGAFDREQTFGDRFERGWRVWDRGENSAEYEFADKNPEEDYDVGRGRGGRGRGLGPCGQGDGRGPRGNGRGQGFRSDGRGPKGQGRGRGRGFGGR